MQIRRATGGDIDTMAAMIAELFGLEPDYIPNPAKHRAGLELLLRREDAALFVAEEGPAIVGMVTVQLTISTAQGGPSGLIEDLFVSETWRGRGLATELVAAVERWCLSMGAHRVQLLCDSGNTGAIAFYGARGYEGTRMHARRRFIGTEKSS